MKLIGIFKGTYEGHDYAKVIALEPMNRVDGFGTNAVVSKLNLDEYERLRREWDLWADQEVYLVYNRFGRVDRVELAG